MSYGKCESPISKVVVSEKPKATLSISPQEVEVGVGKTVTFGGKLLGSRGNPIVGKTVHLIVGKDDVAQTVTDSGGNWVIEHTFAEAGKYSVKASYTGD